MVNDLKRAHMPEVIKTDYRNEELKKKFNDIKQEEWSETWSREPTCRQTRLFWPQPDPEISKCVLDMDREDLSKIIQMTTGHGFNKYHQSLVTGIDQDKSCRFCNLNVEESYHIINDCPSLSAVRAKFWDKAGQSSWKWPTDIPRLRGFFSEEPLVSLFDPGQRINDE